MRKLTVLSLMVLLSSLLPFDSESFRARRSEVRKHLGPGSAMVLFTADVQRRNGDVDHEYRPDSDFWYLTGHPEPDARLILTGDDFSGKDEIGFEGGIIFVQPRDPLWQKWNVERLGVSGAKEKLGFQHFAASDSFETVLSSVLPHVDTLFTNREWVRHGGGWTADLNRFEKIDLGGVTLMDAGAIVHPLRRVKSGEEVDIIQRAIDITGEAMVQAMARTRPGLFEYNIEATIEFVFTDLGSKRLGFPSIIGSGPNSTILHYTGNDRLMEKSDLLLMDVGAEYEMYTADITRTIPVNGKFTEEQKELYTYLLKAQQAAFDSARAGMTLRDLHRVAKNYLNNKGFDRYFVHGIGHWLGLDVHDVGGRTAEIRVGSVFTIEPGIYIPVDDSSLPESYRGMGIRVEDVVLMTESGPVWLLGNIPKEIDEIEKVMRRGRHRLRRR